MEDDRLSIALNEAGYRYTLNNQRMLNQMRLRARLGFSVNGGTFSVTPELIAFVHAMVANGSEELVLCDINENPIRINDSKVFLEDLIDVYTQAHNEYLANQTELRKARSTEAVVGV